MQLGRQGRLGLAVARVRTMLHPGVTVVAPPPMTIERDVAATMRDGIHLRVNVHRPVDDAPVPAVVSAHPYGKDRVPANQRSRRNRQGLNPQYHLFPQPDAITISDLTGWEAPDPGFWVPNGYAVVNADLRGCGTSEGRATLLSQQEGEDYHDLIEWVAAQPWCDGRVGLDGVSYLAVSQYRAAEQRPPHLAAMCPWEGFTDLYRDFARPGGAREDGFSIMWSAMTRRVARVDGNVRKEFVQRRQRDHWYRERDPDLSRVDVPMLVCASFSDQSLHTRGSFEGFRRSGSARKWLTTHRGGKWSTYYGSAASAERLAFFDHVLKDADNGWAQRAPVVVKVFEHDGPPVAEISADEWPPRELVPRTVHLDDAGRLRDDAVPGARAVSFATRRDTASWRWTVEADVDVVGPMVLVIHVSLGGDDDAILMASIRKFRAGREVHFQGSYGFAHDVVTKGWQRVAHRALDPELSTPLQPVHTHTDVVTVGPDEVVPVELALLPHATRFRAGDVLQLDLRGRWGFPRNPLTGQFPAWYQRSTGATCTVHTGADHDSSLTFGTLTPTVA